MMRLCHTFLGAALWASLLAPPVSRAADIKIACIGDSITLSSNLGAMTFPARLDGLLGAGYVVRNYGVSATTLLKNGDFPYWRQAQYEQSLEWNPDIVVILLGTNDSKTFNWVHADAFVPDFTEFVRSYQEIDSQPRILLATPTPLFGEDLAPFDSEVMSQQIAPAIREVSKQLECEVVEFHDRMLALKALFPDGVHPDARGTSVMAAILFDAIGSAPTSDLSPSLTIEPNGSRVSIRWPVSAAGYVLQESPWLHEDDTSWEVSPLIAKHDGQAIATGTRKRKPTFFYRLWKP